MSRLDQVLRFQFPSPNLANTLTLDSGLCVNVIITLSLRFLIIKVFCSFSLGLTLLFARFLDFYFLISLTESIVLPLPFIPAGVSVSVSFTAPPLPVYNFTNSFR